MVAMERFDGMDDPPRREILVQSMRAAKSAMGLGPVLGELHNRRNSALLNVEMGLGEYSYIYVMAYHDRMIDPGERTGIMDGPTVNRRMHDVLAEMLARQLQQAEALTVDQRDALETEIAAMAAEDRRVPWQDGLPDSIAASFTPFRDQLDEYFCPGMTEMELLKATRRRFGIESE
jgi:hypothetical protein